MSEPQYRWSACSLDELVARYETDIHPEFEAASGTAHAYPTAEWLRKAGYSGLRYALREHHDCTLREFLVDEVGLPTVDDRPSGPRFGIRDDRTATAVDAYFSRREDHGLLSSSTLDSKRSRWRRWVRTYRRLHGTDALVSAAADGADEPVERQRCRRVLDQVAPTLGTDGSRLTFVSDIRAVYSWLSDEGYIAFNPLAGVESEYDWERGTPDNLALTTAHVQTLYQAAANAGEELLVIGLAGWGLRPNELAALHVSQLVLEGEDPHIAFDEDRKNGPGTVPMLYGRPTVLNRVEQLAETPDWNGYLFPSEGSASGHRVADTIRNRFVALAERAGVKIDGATPTPKLGRRYWYQEFSDAMADIMEQLGAVADEQGSTSATVVWQNYHSEAERRDRRRRAMRSRLADAFDP